MASYGFRERVLSVKEDGSALTSSNTQTSILPASADELALPIGFARIGRAIEFCFSGRISTVVTTPGTLDLELRFGSTDVFSSGAMSLNTTAQTNRHWTLEGTLICRATGTGTSTTWFPVGCKFTSHAVIGSAEPTAGGAGVHVLPYNTPPAVGTGYDNSASQAIDLLAQWSAVNANSITLHGGWVDVYI